MVTARQVEPAGDVQGVSKRFLRLVVSNDAELGYKRVAEERLIGIEKIYEELKAVMRNFKLDEREIGCQKLSDIFGRMVEKDNDVATLMGLEGVTGSQARDILRYIEEFIRADKFDFTPSDAYNFMMRRSKLHETASAYAHLYEKFREHKKFFLSLQWHWIVYNKDFWAAKEALETNAIKDAATN
uniref:Uncharacterized protein n=1 Tax=Peronospora matthiolae TaxID=2874970 RepID=A0AAV1TRW1_9STRA